MKPTIFNKNSKIKFIAPAGPIQPEQLTLTENIFTQMGFRCSFGKRILCQNHYLAGSDDERLLDLHEAFADKSISAIICIRGGYGSARLLEKIDYDLIKNNPKIFIGYSDITALLNSFWQKAGLVCFHGIMGNSSFTDYTKLQLSNLLTNDIEEISTYKKDDITIIKQGKARGKLAGGNLAIVNSLIGTDYEVNFADKIAFFEDIGEDLYKIDRMLTQLLLTKNFRKVKAIILGEFTNCTNDTQNNSDKNPLSLNDIFVEKFKSLTVPVISGFSFGHVDNQAIFPIGINAEIDTDNAHKIKLLEPIFNTNS